MTQIDFFAMRNDWLQVFDRVEESVSLQYIRCGHHAHEPMQALTHGRDLPCLGTAAGEQLVACDAWVVAPREATLLPRAIDRIDGTRVYAMDQLVNEDAIVLTTGGVWTEATLIRSNIGTIATAGVGMQLQRQFSSCIKQLSDRVGDFWVAPGARAHLEAGWRLCTAGASSPPEYDLPWPAR